VRQAGALWGIALLYRDDPTPQTKEAVLKGLEFFQSHSLENETGNMYVVYPHDNRGSTGTMALLVLTLTELLQTDLPPDEREMYKNQLDQYLGFLLSLRMENGQFFSKFDIQTGKGSGDPSPYFDGESLLAMINALKYAGHAELKETILSSAEAMYQKNEEEARKADPDSSVTKGFYQWGSMAFYEIFTTGWSGVDEYASRTVDMAYWMIDTHGILQRRKNTAYAFEGLISAWELARLTENQPAMEKIGKAIDSGLYTLTTWQVGNNIENVFLRRYEIKNPQKDPLAHGGIMNERNGTTLRIDVTQHQMHAVLLARSFLYQ
jgi:hypothetical protein